MPDSTFTEDFMYPTAISKKTLPSSARITVYSLLLNLSLVVGKSTFGILASAPVLVSDAVHSAADLFSTLIVLVGILLGMRMKKPLYFESTASILLAVILGVTAVRIGYYGILSIVRSDYLGLPAPELPAALMAILAILLKLRFFAYARRIAELRASTALRADAYHHLTDAAASTGTLIGITAARLGYPIFDPIASVFVACFILSAAIGILFDAYKRLRYSA